jgi:hypothetical protein
MVSISNWLTLGLIGGGILAFYKLGGAGGIGSKIGGGFSSLFDSFTSSIFPVSDVVGRLAENIQNPALNPVLVAAAELEAAITKDPNTEKGKFEPPLGSPEYDPYDPFKTTSTNPMTENDNFIAANQSHPTSWNLESLSGVTITGMYNSSTGGSGGSSTGGGAGGGSGATTTGSSTGGGSTAASSSTGGGSTAASSSTGSNNAGGSSGSQTGGSTGGSTSRAKGRATRYG